VAAGTDQVAVESAMEAAHLERAVLAHALQVERAVAAERRRRRALSKEAVHLLLLCQLIKAVGVEHGERSLEKGRNVPLERMAERTGGNRTRLIATGSHCRRVDIVSRAVAATHLPIAAALRVVAVIATTAALAGRLAFFTSTVPRKLRPGGKHGCARWLAPHPRPSESRGDQVEADPREHLR
jgi:hypothetical protein